MYGKNPKSERKGGRERRRERGGRVVVVEVLVFLDFLGIFECFLVLSSVLGVV